MTRSALLHENQRLQAVAAELRAELAVEKLRRLEAEAKINDLLRRLFGPKSEKIDPRQHLLALESVEADRKIAEAEPPQPAAAPTLRPKRGARRPIPEHLPVERIVHDLPEDQKKHPETGQPLVKIREEITEEIDYRPSQFVRIVHVTPVYAAADKSCAPVQAHPVRVIPQSIAGPGLLSHIVVSKYADHLPLYRLEQMAARHGVALDRQKMSLWVEKVALLLQTLHGKLEKRLLESKYVQADETPVKVLDPARPNAAREAWLWVRHAPTVKVILFDFEMTRRHSVPAQYFPPDWAGDLQSDGYQAYENLADNRPLITPIRCWTHARRYWVEAADHGGQTVAEILALIAQLYRVEADARGKSHQERAALRSARSEILLDQLYKKMLDARTQALPQSRIGKAASYALKRWGELTVYARPGFGHVEIDNNSIENGIRQTALGKKNWLFIGHPEAGWKSAVIYSILGTCKLLAVEPYGYLTWVLPKLAAATNHTTDGLLPHDYSKLIKEPAKSAPPAC